MKNKQMRKGFALIYAVIMLILVGSVGMHTLYLINKTSSISIKEHIKTQMELYVSSTIEYTLLWLSENQTYSTNPQNLTITYPGNYTFNVLITPLNIPNTIPESQGTVMLDITGQYNDNQHPFITTKRTIQKP